jgi:hypothetical protein
MDAVRMTEYIHLDDWGWLLLNPQRSQWMLFR